MEYMKKTVNIGSRRELFVDDEMFLDVGSARFVAHQPQPREIAVGRDTLADDAWTSYYSIIHDGTKYLLYYTAHGWDGMMEGEWPHQHICRAESTDGIHWEKPNYGIYEFRGTKENNIVYLLEGDLLDNFGVMYDTNPNCPENERYKALAERVIDKKAVLNAVVSADGIHWEDRGTVITDGTFDSLNTCYYDPQEDLYHAYTRGWEIHNPSRFVGESDETDFKREDAQKARSITAFTSKDFYHWSEGQPLDYGTAHSYQLYTNNIGPYYRAPHMIFGFPTRYFERTFKRMFRELPKGKKMTFPEGEPVGRGVTTLTDGLFMTSRDGIHFTRYDDCPIFPSGIEGQGNWIYGDGYGANGMYETPSDRPEEPNVISLLVPDNAYGAMRRYEMRLDGFVSLHAGCDETVIVSHPFIFDGDRLEFNYKTTVAGSFYVELLDLQKNPYPGFEMSQCDEMFGDTVARDISWNENHDVGSLKGKPVILRIKMKECDLYSFRFYSAQ